MALKEKIVALSADITNTNFGGLARKGINNVRTKVQTELKKNVLLDLAAVLMYYTIF